MPSHITRQAKIISRPLFLWLLTSLMAVFQGGCHPPARLGDTRDTLLAQLGRRLLSPGPRRAAERLVRAEKARGEETRAQVLWDALYLQEVESTRTDLLNRLLDVQRPERPPYIDQLLGLEPHPPLLYSTADRAALMQVAQALRGGGILLSLLVRAQRLTEAGEFLDAAGTLVLAQAVATVDPPGELELRTLRRRWHELSQRRRCAARLVDAVRTGEAPRLFAEHRGVGAAKTPEAQVAEDLRGEESPMACAVTAVLLLRTEPVLSPLAGMTTKALLLPLLSPGHFARVELLSAERARPAPLVRGDAGQMIAAIERGVEQYLLTHTDQAAELLPLLRSGPNADLKRPAREEVALSMLFRAPPLQEGAPRIRLAYVQRREVVARDPVRYVRYMAKVGPAWAGAAALALREPSDSITGEVVAALSGYGPRVGAELDQALRLPVAPPATGPGRWVSLATVQAELSGVPQLLTQERQRLRERMGALRALFRLAPMAAEPRGADADVAEVRQEQAAEERAARRLALELHRCCRQDQAACERLSVEPPRACPAWTPLRYW